MQKNVKLSEIESVSLNGKEYPKYNLGDKDTENKVLLLAVVLKRVERPYKDKQGNSKIAVSLAEIGSNFGGENLGNINLRVLVTPARQASTVKATFEA